MPLGTGIITWWRKLMASRLAIITVGAFILLLMVALYGSRPAFLALLDSKLYDVILATEHHRDTAGEVVIVDLDERSLASYGQWPWPRYRVALLLKRITEMGAAAVGLDIVFAEPDRTSPVVLQEYLHQDLQLDVDFSGLPPQLMDHDRVLGRELAAGPYALGFPFNFDVAAMRDVQCEPPHPLKIAMLRAPGAPDPAFIRAPDAVCNIPELQEAASATGFFSTVADQDGVLRSTPLIIEYRDKVYPSLSIAALMLKAGLQQAVLRVGPDGLEGLRIGSWNVPVDVHGRLLLHYRGAGRTFPYVSAADVMNGLTPRHALEDKIVFVGTSAAGLRDLRSTPLASVYPGVEAHATVVDNILLGDYLYRPSWAPGLEVGLIVLFGAVTTLLLFSTGAALSLIVLALSGLGVWELTLWLFRNEGMYISPLMPLLTLAVIFTALTLFKFVREEGAKKFLHSTFQSYLSSEIIDQIVESKKMPELGGQERVVSAFFTDIQDFSAFAEILTPAQLVELLNEYLSAMTDILMQENGTLDKYEGDAIIAFFGAPVSLPDHGVRACRAALAMQERLVGLRRKWEDERIGPDEPERNLQQHPPNIWKPGAKWPVIVHRMRMRIGMNSGLIVVGNMGSSMRMNYTMMGDAVNLAARLEAAAKQYGVFTVVSGQILDEVIPSDDGSVRTVRDTVAVRFLDRVQVVGRHEPVMVYELCAMAGEESEQDRELIRRYEAAWKLYRDRRWEEAVEAFKHADAVERFSRRRKTPSRVLMKRCKRYILEPALAPSAEWDGVCILTEK